MTATYTDPSNSNSDFVRFLIGDTDVSNAELQDEEIAAILTETSDEVYTAAAICARALAAKFAKLVDTKFEDVSSDYSNLRDNYYALAQKLEVQAKKYGSKGFGAPIAGGLTYSDIRSNEQNDDRVQPKFKQDQFSNPPINYDPDTYGY